MHATGYSRLRYGQSGGATVAYGVEAQRLIKFPKDGQRVEGRWAESLSQCRRPICDVAVRHISTVAASEESRSIMSTASTRGEVSVNLFLTPVTQRWDTDTTLDLDHWPRSLLWRNLAFVQGNGETWRHASARMAGRDMLLSAANGQRNGRL